METYPPISVVMPVLNEEKHLARSVQYVLSQNYPGDLELILAIGPCTDDTWRIARQLAEQHPELVLLENPTGATPAGLNLAIAKSRHDLIIRVDAHGELSDNYLTTAVELLAETNAANVGGLMDAQGETDFERAVAKAYNSRIGLGGGGFHLADTPAGPADTVFLGCFRKADLLAVGGFDESLRRAQDWELNYRLRQAGKLVYFSPKLRVTYRPRSSVKALAKQFFQTGQWRREVIRRYPETASARYLAPPFAVTGASIGVVSGLFGQWRNSRFWKLGWLAPVGYLSIIASATVAAKGLPPKVRAWFFVVLIVMHFSWGAGFLVGR